MSAWLLFLGLVGAAGSLALLDLCTLDLQGGNPTHRYGEMRLMWPGGNSFEVVRIMVHNAVTLVIIAGAALAAFVCFLMAVLSALSLANRSAAITIDEAGIRNWYWGNTLVPWTEIRRIDGISWSEDGEPTVASALRVVVDEPSAYIRSPLLHRPNPMLIKQLYIGLPFLDDPVGLVGALMTRVPSLAGPVAAPKGPAAP